jgi:hypothetical protein
MPWYASQIIQLSSQIIDLSSDKEVNDFVNIIEASWQKSDLGSGGTATLYDIPQIHVWIFTMPFH